jgi:hypothetical protein
VIDLRLPLAADENLREEIAHEMDRQTPFEVERVDFAFRVLERDADARQLNVEVSVATKRVIASALGALRRLGVDVNGAVAEAERPGGSTLGSSIAIRGSGRGAVPTRPCDCRARRVFSAPRERGGMDAHYAIVSASGPALGTFVGSAPRGA